MVSKQVPTCTKGFQPRVAPCSTTGVLHCEAWAMLFRTVSSMCGLCTIDKDLNGQSYPTWHELECLQTWPQGHEPQWAAGWDNCILRPHSRGQQYYRMGKTSHSGERRESPSWNSQACATPGAGCSNTSIIQDELWREGLRQKRVLPQADLGSGSL